MKSFFGICVISALVAVGTTQPTHNSPNHDVEETQYHTQPEHHMSQPQHHIISQPAPPTHNWPQHDAGQAQYHTRPEHQMGQPETPMNQPQHHIMSQPELHFRQPQHYISQPQHDYNSWSTVQAQAHSQAIWPSPEQPSYQPGEISSEPHHINQPIHIIHSQPQPIDHQFELHPYLYQHPHYPPTGSHHTQDSGPQYPTHGWNTQNPVDYQHQLPEAPAPEHHINANNEDYPNQSSAVANAVATSFTNSVPVSNHELAHPGQYKIISIKKPDDGADFYMPVADHETRHPIVFQASKDEGLSDIVKAILAKYRNGPIGIKPKADNNVPSKDHETANHGPIPRPHNHKLHKVPTIPVVTKQNTKAKKPNHKHSHKKVLKPLLDPELLAREFLSKEHWVPSPDKTHKKDIPRHDNPIATADRTNSDNVDCDDESNSPDKNEQKNKPKIKPHHKKHSHISADTSPAKDISEKTTTPSSYINPYDKKDTDKGNNSDLASLGTEPCDSDNPPEKVDKRKKHEAKPKINEKKNINSNPNNDFKEEDAVQKHEVQTKLTKKVETNKDEKLEESEKKKYAGKQNQKTNQSPFKTKEPCKDDIAPEEENEKKKHVLKLKPDDKQNNDPDQNKPENKLKKHHHHKHVPPHTPTNIVPDNHKTKTRIPSINDKPVDHKDADGDRDCDSADDDKTMTRVNIYTVNATDKEDKKKNHLPKFKPNNTKNTTSKPVDDEGHKDTITSHAVVLNKDVKKEKKKKVDTKTEQTVYQSEKTKQQPETIDEKQKPVKEDYNAPVSDESDSTEGFINQEPHDKIYVPELTKEKKPLLNKKNDKPQPVNTNKGNKDTLTDHNVVQNKEFEKEEIKYVYTKKEKTVHQSEKTKQQPETIIAEKQKPVKEDYNAPVSDESDSTEGFINQEPYDKISVPEHTKEKKPLPNKKDDKPQPVNSNKGNKDTLTDHNVVQNKEVEKEEIKNVYTKKEKTVHHSEKTKQQPETIIDEKQKPVKEDYNAPVSDESDSTEGFINQEPYDKIYVPEHTKEKKPLPNKKDDKPQPVNSNEGNKDTLTDHNVVQNKEVEKEEIKNVYTKKEKTVHQSEKTKQQPETIIDEKQKPVKEDYNAPVSDESDSTEGFINQEPYDKISVPEHTKEKRPLPNKKDDKPQPVNSNKGNKDTVTDHNVVQNKEVEKEEIKNVYTKKEKTVHHAEKTKQQPETIIDEKQKPVEQDYNAPISDESDSMEGSVYQGSYDKIPDSKSKDKKEKSIPNIKKDNNKPQLINTNKGKIDTISDHKVVQKKDVKTEEIIEVERKHEKTVHQSEKIKQQPETIDEKQKPVEQDYASVSDEPNLTEASVKKAPYDKIPDSEYNDNKEKSIPNITKDDNKPQPVNTNKGNIDTIPDHKVVQKKDVKKEEIIKVEINKEISVHQSKNTKQQTEIIDENQKAVEQDYNAPVSDESDSMEDSVYQGSYDKIPDSEYKDKKENSIANIKKDDNKLQPVNTNKGNIDTIHDHKVVQKKDVEKEEIIKVETKKGKTILQSEKTKQQPETIDKKLKPVERDYNAPINDESNSTEGSDKNEPHDKIPDSEYNDDKEKSIKIIKKHDNRPQPVNTNKGNIDTIQDHKVVQKKYVKKEDIIEVEKKKEKTVLQSEKTKQQPETIAKKQKPVEQDYNAPVSDESDSTEGLINQEPYDKISAPEHTKEKKPVPNKKDDYKPVSPDTDKGNKDKISITKKDVKKVEQTKEVTREVVTKKETKIDHTKNDLKPHKYEGILKPEKQENKSPDIEDCDSTESHELQKPLGKKTSPEHEREYKKPLQKANQHNKASKDQTKEKKIDKEEETVKVEIKTKKSAKNMVSSKAVDKPNPVETSNENSDIDNCDSVDSETHPKLDKIKPSIEKRDPKKTKAEEVKKKKVIIARNKAAGKATSEEPTSGEVAKTLKKTETDQPLSTVGFLFSLFTHALQGSDSVRQMFEEPKVKKFVKNIIPMFYEKPNQGIVSDYA